MSTVVFAFPPVAGAPPDPPRELLGGKGAGLVLMTRLGLPVPPGFVITTAATRQFRPGDGLPPAVRAAVRAELDRLALRTGRRFGGPGEPLLVSVRSGAPASMPGMLDTLLDVGKGEGERAFAELDSAIAAVVRSWTGARAVTYRRLRGLDGATGTAVVVQAMVDGTVGGTVGDPAGGRSGTGVLFTRDPATGAPGLTGEYLPGARGPDLVDGVRTPQALSTMDASGREELSRAAGELERALADMVEIEFTVEDGRLWLLQVRPGKRTGRAALRIAVDLAEEGLISRAEAVRRCPESTVDGAVDSPSVLAGLPEEQVLCRGLPGSPGAAVGRIALDLAATEEYTDRGDPVILVRAVTEPGDLPAMALAAGVLTAAGGTTSHAAVVARELGVPCVCGATPLRIDLDRRVIVVSGRELPEGALISIDGTAAVVAAGAYATVADAGHGHDRHRRELLASWAGAA